MRWRNSGTAKVLARLGQSRALQTSTLQPCNLAPHANSKGSLTHASAAVSYMVRKELDTSTCCCSNTTPCLHHVKWGVKRLHAREQMELWLNTQASSTC